MKQSDRAYIDSVLNSADRLADVLRVLLVALSDGEIEIAREAWGNTNTRLVKEAKAWAQAALREYNGRMKG